MLDGGLAAAATGGTVHATCPFLTLGDGSRGVVLTGVRSIGEDSGMMDVTAKDCEEKGAGCATAVLDPCCEREGGVRIMRLLEPVVVAAGVTVVGVVVARTGDDNNKGVGVVLTKRTEARTNKPELGGAEKYRMPCTAPSFFPLPIESPVKRTPTQSLPFVKETVPR